MERQIELRRVDQPTRKASEASTEQQHLNESCLRYRSQRQLSSEMTGFCAFLQQPKKTCLQTLEAAATKKRQKVAAAIIFETAKTVTKGYYCISVFFANVKFFSLFSRTRNEKSETRFSCSDVFFGLSWVVKSGKRRWPLRFAKNLITWTGSHRTLSISWPWRRSSRWLSGT